MTQRANSSIYLANCLLSLNFHQTQIGPRKRKAEHRLADPIRAKLSRPIFVFVHFFSKSKALF
ncbi:hypothetical protein BpHYR1_043883 [Brachionus plicatilis]|uniref:Uncharacterized protein n=1 Tax=Brachionus plicatilis TaxID=10195 RepID=A0A3M7T883_BRAPC|nr:hypothetical protein BpHYR1_043883 [Brachionus plicatilis]